MSMFDGMIKNFLASLEKDVEAVDDNHDGHPDKEQALSLLSSGFAQLLPYLQKIDWPAAVARFFPEIPATEIPIVISAAQSVYAGTKLLAGVVKDLYEKRLG